MAKHITKEILRDHNLAPKKRFGQNFLIHSGTAQAIAQYGDISDQDCVVEVGVGLGALTLHLARRAQKIIGIEVDSGLVRYHAEEQTLPPNVTLLHGDILRLDFKELVRQCGGPLKIVANLPYSISNPFIFKLIDNKEHLDWVIVMLQKEVAERLMASPSTKEYGIPTVLLRGCATIEKLKRLGPQEFHPQPKIDSLVIRLNFSQHWGKSTRSPSFDYTFLSRVVRTAFAKRRKTLLNNLINLQFSPSISDFQGNRQFLLEALVEAGLAPGERAENLTIEDFIRLTTALEKRSAPEDKIS
ncbi:MAG: 16S rRNA (adenine(1518)-N(6)/adenine(1519)-N(6))-dimethyltransferase RsmA [Desulfopila sp.]|jgi:16S rRNA (adenine1518-N6/adenine1519-N6)-dimethyltransferase|nr:16S rRNA (adenine(1518)-N(6)/adenine(1519)-N(6))-dimethyltransferase RsmA [Desulfopila sp.]